MSTRHHHHHPLKQKHTPRTYAKTLPHTVETRRNVLFTSVSSDGTFFFARGNQSWSPYTGVCFNLPPWLRNKFACLFMFGVMPIKIKNYGSTHMNITLIEVS